MPSQTISPENKITTRSQAEAAVELLARAMALLEGAIANRDKEVLDVQTRHSPLIAKLTEDIGRLNTAVEDWANKNRSEFGDKQSLEFPAGVLKFNAGKPRVELLEGWDIQRVLKAMKGFWRKYLRPKVELDKVAIQRAFAAETVNKKKLATVGLKVVQEESFDIEVRPVPNTLKNVAA